jgi:hypothetical protein
VTDVVHLTTVASQGESDVICGLLRVNGIQCSERSAGPVVERAAAYGGYREILVFEDDLERARDLLASTIDSPRRSSSS